MPISPYAWHFVSHATVVVGSGTEPVLDFYVDVTTPVEWRRPVNGRLAEDPLGGETVQIIRSTDATPRRRGDLSLAAIHGPQRETDRANILAAWALKGPFDVTTPEGETFALMLDVVSGTGLLEQWQGGNRLFRIPIIEVGA